MYGAGLDTNLVKNMGGNLLNHVSAFCKRLMNETKNRKHIVWLAWEWGGGTLARYSQRCSASPSARSWLEMKKDGEPSCPAALSLSPLFSMQQVLCRK